MLQYSYLLSVDFVYIQISYPLVLVLKQKNKLRHFCFIQGIKEMVTTTSLTIHQLPLPTSHNPFPACSSIILKNQDDLLLSSFSTHLLALFSNSTSFDNHHLATWRSVVTSKTLNRSNEFLAFDHLAEYRVFSIQMWRGHLRGVSEYKIQVR